ncbi:MAG: hypothetical protein ACKV2V_30730 [Blastocatellia bacterium]
MLLSRQAISLLSLFAPLLLACACAAPRAVDIPQAEGARQPAQPFIPASAQRQQTIEEKWRQLLAEYGLPDGVPELEPILLTPRALPAGMAGRINLNLQNNLNPQNNTLDATQARETLRRFLARAGGLLCGDTRETALSLKDLSLVTFGDEGTMYRAVYQQMNMPLPLAGGYGGMTILMSKKGLLLQLQSRIVSPLLVSGEIHSRPGVSPQQATDTLMGRVFSYSNAAGQPVNYKVEQRDAIDVRELVILPRVDNDRMLLHLAWRVEVGRGMTWTVYIDALSGAELDVRQNFQT